jgi:hypothetical protein
VVDGAGLELPLSLFVDSVFAGAASFFDSLLPSLADVDDAALERPPA